MDAERKDLFSGVGSRDLWKPTSLKLKGRLEPKEEPTLQSRSEGHLLGEVPPAWEGSVFLL